MESTTLAIHDSAWELIADLAARGNDSVTLRHATELGATIVERVQITLQCPWVLLQLHTPDKPLVVGAHIAPETRDALLAGKATAVPLPMQVISLGDEHNSLGTLWLGTTPQTEAIFTPGFVDVLRRQIELLVHMQQREAARYAEQLDAARELFVIHENGKLITSGLPTETMLARIVENIALALQVDRCALYLLDRVEANVLNEAASYSFDENEELPFPRYIVQSHDPVNDVLKNNVVHVLDGEHNRHEPVLGFQSGMFLPLKARDITAGVLAIGFLAKAYTFSRAEQHVAQTLADQIAVAIIGIQAAEAEQRRARELDALQELSLQLGADQPIDDTLHAIMRGVRGFIPFAGAQINLFDAQAHVLRIGSRLGLLGERTMKSEFGQGHLLSSGLAGWLGRYRQSLRLATFERPPIKPIAVWLVNGSAPLSYLGMPLLVGEQLVGTIELYGDRPGAFSVDHERLLQLVATQAAQAIASARQFSRTDAHLRSRVQQLTALQRISRQLTATLSLDLIFSFALDEALQATTATQAFIALRTGTSDGLPVTDADNGDLIAMVGLNEESAEPAYSVLTVVGYGAQDATLIGQPLNTEGTTAGVALFSGEPQRVDELEGDDRLNASGPAVAAALAMPVYYENQTVGVVNLHSERSHAFDHDTVEFVRALTDQVALALGNARRYDEQQRQRTLLQKRAGMLKQVLDIGQALRADQSLDDVLEQIAFSVIDTAGFRRAVFNVVDPEDQETIRPVAGAGLTLIDLERLRNHAWPKGFVERILAPRFRIGRCYFVPAEFNAEVREGFDLDGVVLELEIEATSAEEWHATDMLFVPLYSTDSRLIGILSVDEPYNRLRPTLRTIEALEVLSDQAAIAIENTNLLREARAQTEYVRALYQVGTATVATSNLDDLLNRVYAEIAAYMGHPDFFFVASYNQQRETIRFEIFNQNGYAVEDYYGKVVPKRGLTGYVIDRGEILNITDYQAQAASIPAEPIVINDPLQSWVGIPLRNQNSVIGVLSVQSYKPHAFAERHIRFLHSLANQLAIALDNVRLFQDRGQRIAELDVINDIGRITSTRLDMGEMLAQTYERLESFLPIDAGYIFTFMPARNYLDVAFEHDEDTRTIDTKPRIVSDKGLTQYILHTRQPLLFQDLRYDPRPNGVTPKMFGAEHRSSASWLGVPLLGNDGTIVGVLSIQSYKPNLYGEREVAFLTTVASQLALGVQNVRLLSRTREQVRQLGLLNQVSLVGSSTLELDTIYQTIVDVMASALGVDQARLMLFDRERDTIWVAAQLHALPQERYNFGKISGYEWVAWLDTHREPLVVADLQDDNTLVSIRDMLATEDIHSTVFVPLIVANNVIGAISLDSTDQRRDFNMQDVELCQLIAHQASTAIEKARLFEQVEQNAEVLGSKVSELSTLLEAARVLSSALRPDEVLGRLMDLVGSHLHVNTVGLWTITANHMLQPVALLGIAQEIADRMQVPVGKGLTGLVAASGTPLIVSDVSSEGTSLYPEFNREHQLTSFMGVPVVYSEQVVGVLSVMTIERREFSADEQMLLAGMADQAAIALENSRLFSERDRRIAELTSFNRISQRLNAVLDLDSLLHVVHEEIGKVLDHTDSFIAMYDAATQKISYPIHWKAGRQVRDTVVLDAITDPSLSRRVIAERRSMLLRTRDQMINQLHNDTMVEVNQHGVASWLSVPIMEGETVYGILNVQHDQPNRYDTDDERFLTTVAGIAATSIARVRLFNERERRLSEVSVLQEVSSAISSSLNLQDILQQLHTKLGRVVDVSTSFIGLYDHTTELLTYQIAVDHGIAVSFPPVPMARSGMNGWAIRNRQPLLVGREEDAWQYRIHQYIGSRIGPEDKSEQSYLVVPIVSGETALGVINIQSYLQDAFSADDLRFVSAVANQAAAAINNARLFEDRERRIQELSTFNEIGRQFSAIANLDDLLELIYRQTSRLLDTTNFYVGLYDEYADVVSFPLYYNNGKQVTTKPLTSPVSLSHYVIRTRAPFVLQGQNQQIQLEASGITPYGEMSRSWLGVPMIANDQVIGLIAIQDYERDNAYSEENVRLLSTLASWGGVALANARLFNDQRQNLRELGLLYEMSMRLAGTLDAADIQQIVVTTALELLHAQFGALVVFSEDQQITQQFVLDNDQYDHEQFVEAVRPLYNQLVNSERSLVIRDSTASEQNQFVQQLGVRALLGEVLGSREQPLGAIWIGDRHPRDWQGRELSLLPLIATLSNQALQRAHLFKREQQRRVVADTLRTVAERLTGVLKLEDVYALLLDQLAQVVAYDSASLMLREQNDDVLRIVATRGFPDHQRAEVEQLSFRLSEDKVLGQIFHAKQPIVEPDVTLTPDYIQEIGTEYIRGWMGVPLVLVDEVIGLLTVDSYEVDAYNEEDVQIAFTLASQAAQAISNARLFEEVQRGKDELEQRVEDRTAELAESNTRLANEQQRLQAVHAITVELTTSLEMNETLRKTLRLASSHLGVRRGSIMLWNDQERQLVCRAVLGEDGHVHAENIPIAFRRGNGLSDWVRETQQSIRIADVRKDRRWAQEPGRAQDVRSVIAVPLYTEGVGVLGVLMLTSPELDYFAPDHEQLLTTIANEVAIVIHNAELYQLVEEYASRSSTLLNEQREEAGKNQAILRSLGEGVVVLDESDTIIMVNPAAESILDIEESTILGQHLRGLLHHNQKETPATKARSQLVYDTLEAGVRSSSNQLPSQQMRLELTNPPQSLELYFTTVALPGTISHYSVVVLRDVTREIEADRAKRDFISSVSHELRTPLTAIKGYVDLLTLGAAGPINENQASFLHVVKNNANRLIDLINDILEIGRIDSNKIQLNFEPLDIHDIFSDVMQTMRSEIERKNMQVSVFASDDLPLIEADERRLTQVVLNLASNAIKYTYAGGKIELRASLNPSGMLEVSVADDGVGITAEQQQYLFRRFYRADNPLRDEAGGTGLGLSIAKSFIELHGGEMWVKSDAEEGSTFSFVVPVTQLQQPGERMTLPA